MHTYILVHRTYGTPAAAVELLFSSANEIDELSAVSVPTTPQLGRDLFFGDGSVGSWWPSQSVCVSFKFQISSEFPSRGEDTIFGCSLFAVVDYFAVRSPPTKKTNCRVLSSAAATWQVSAGSFRPSSATGTVARVWTTRILFYNGSTLEPS